MTIIDKLASSLNRRDDVPNKELATLIAGSNDKKAVKELFDNLVNKKKEIQSDCIKVIYEIGEQHPKLIAGHAAGLIVLLDNKNNRLQWGAMTALNTITTEVPQEIYAALTKIIAAADKGSVITNDHCVAILVKLGTIKEYADDAFSLLNERLQISPVNQLPTYAENMLPLINDSNRAIFITTLTSRLHDMEPGTKRARLEKVIKKARS